MHVTASSTEHGVVAHLAPPHESKTPDLDIILCVDVSYSMGALARGKEDEPLTGDSAQFSLLDIAKHAMQTIIAMLDDETIRVAICSYADDVQWNAPFTACDAKGKAALVAAAMGLRPRGFTNLLAGLRASYTRAAEERRPSAACRIVLLNDGQPSDQYHPQGDGSLTERYTRHLAPWTSRASFTTLTCVGLGYNLNSRLMADLGVFLHVPTFGDVGAFLVNLTAWMCSMITLPDGTPASNVQVVVSAGGATTTLALEQLVCERTVDVVLECPTPAEEVCVQLFADKTMVLNELVAVTGRALCVEEMTTRERVASLLAEAARADVWTTSRDAVHAANRLVSSTPVVRGSPLAETLATEVTLAVETASTWSKWGQHYLRTFAPMLKARRRSNFRDLALQEFAMTDDGTPGRFEAFVQQGEVLFATLTIVPSHGGGGAAPAARRVPDQFFRGGGCIHEDVFLQVSDEHHRVVIKRASAIRKGDWIQTPQCFARVRMVAKTCCPTNYVELVSLGGNVNPLLITPWHPVCYEGTWQFPCNVTRAELHKSAFVYSFVLEDACSFVANGIECAALGHGLKAPHVAHHSYWGDEVVGLMEAVLAAHPDEGGVVDMTRICHKERRLRA